MRWDGPVPGVIELLCALGLVLPAFNKSLGLLALIAAILIAAEMLLFCVLHISSADSSYCPMIYWLPRDSTYKRCFPGAGPLLWSDAEHPAAGKLKEVAIEAESRVDIA
jgi:hypothetical protein